MKLLVYGLIKYTFKNYSNISTDIILKRNWNTNLNNYDKKKGNECVQKKFKNV